MEYGGPAAVGIIFQVPALPSPQFGMIWFSLGRNLNDKKKNRLWEDGADDSDDMVVRASHACKSLMAAAIADDRHRDIDP
jgi:hypothetical protein